MKRKVTPFHPYIPRLKPYKKLKREDRCDLADLVIKLGISAGCKLQVHPQSKDIFSDLWKYLLLHGGLDFHVQLVVFLGIFVCFGWLGILLFLGVFGWSLFCWWYFFFLLLGFSLCCWLVDGVFCLLWVLFCVFWDNLLNYSKTKLPEYFPWGSPGILLSAKVFLEAY